VALTREQILARKVAGHTEEHKLGDDVVIIRGLSFAESIEVRTKLEAGDLAAGNAIMFHYALVDPALSLDDVDVWMASDEGGELTRLGNHISELSGLVEGAGKSGVPRARKRS
jgi:hypothetical protein